MLDVIKLVLIKNTKRRFMKGIKMILASIAVLLFLLLFQIGILIGGEKGAESILELGLVPILFVMFALLRKD